MLQLASSDNTNRMIIVSGWGYSLIKRACMCVNTFKIPFKVTASSLWCAIASCNTTREFSSKHSVVHRSAEHSTLPHLFAIMVLPRTRAMAAKSMKVMKALKAMKATPATPPDAASDSDVGTKRKNPKGASVLGLLGKWSSRLSGDESLAIVPVENTSGSSTDLYQA